MARPGESESPFKKDDPAGRSRKWVLIVFYFWILSALFMLAGWIVDPMSLGEFLAWAQVLTPVWIIIRDPDYHEIYGFLTMMIFLFVIVIAAVVMTVQLWRIARAAKHCQEKRSFDVMAAAVRSQQVFWGMAAAGTLCAAIFVGMLGIQLMPAIKAAEQLFLNQEKVRQQPTPGP